MATRTGAGYLWALITDLFDGDDLNREKLYKECIHRLQDYGIGVRDMVNSLRSQLSSTDAGQPAVLRSPTVLDTLAFYDPIDVPLGSLDGKTLFITTDLGAATVTFAQPTSPAHAASQVNTQASSTGVIATVDDGIDPVTGSIVPANVGKLLLVRPGGATATLSVGLGGTANGVLGFTGSEAASGTGTANDGASKIGIAAFTSPTGWAGGTLRDFLQALFSGLDMTNADVALKLAKAGDTFTGPLVPSGSTARVRKRAPVLLPTTSASFGPTADEFVIPNFTGATITYTANLTTAPALAEGDDILIISPGFNGGSDVATIATEGGPTLATIDDGSVYTWIRIGLDTTNNSPNKTPYVKSYGPSITLILPYNLP